MGRRQEAGSNRRKDVTDLHFREPSVMNTRAVRGVDRIVALVAAMLKLSLIAATAIMVGCIALQVVMRYVFGRTPSWTEELAVLMFSWSVMGGLALGVRERAPGAAGAQARLDAPELQARGRQRADEARDAATAMKELGEDADTARLIRRGLKELAR